MAERCEPVLVTGVGGFIGYHVARAPLAEGCEAIHTDHLAPYYDPALKRARLDALAGASTWRFRELDLADRAAAALFAEFRPPRLVHLAAQAGVSSPLTKSPLSLARRRGR